MSYNKNLKIDFLIDPFIDEFFKYKYMNNLSIKEKEYINYLISKIDYFVREAIKCKNKEDIIYIGNRLFELWIEYDIPLYEKYFDNLNI